MKSALRRGALVATLSALCCPALASDPVTFKLVRSDEDYSGLKDLQSLSGMDRLRFIPLTPSRDSYLTLGGEARLRIDAFDAPQFGVEGTRSDAFALTRMLFSADLHLESKVRVYGELGLHRDLGKTGPPSPTDRGGLDLQLLFLDAHPTPEWRVRVGRQELMLSPTQRFIAVREGPNIRQAFDGVRLTRITPVMKLDVFHLQPVAATPRAFDDRRDFDQRFYGGYASADAGEGRTLDLYVLGLERDGVSFAQSVGDERRIGIGARLAGRTGPFDYEIEGMRQGGTFAGQRIRAWGASVGGGYSFRAAWTPRLALRFDVGSGDDDSGDGTLETFNPMFPRGAYFNETALTSWSNLRATRVSLGAAPRTPVYMELSYTVRRRETGQDAIYQQPLVALPGSLTSSAEAVGDTVQFDIAWQVNRNVKVQFQAAAVAAGEAVEMAGGRDVRFATAILQYRF